jgi:hypothetical protein
MPICKVQVRIPWTTLAAGSTYQSTNVLSFDSAATPITEATTTGLLAAVIDCYESLDGLFGQAGAGTISATAYDMSVATPPKRPPVNEAFGTYTPGANTVPTESTMLCTFKADPAPLVSRRKRRGRVNLGPLDTTTLMPGGYVTAAAIATAADAFEALATAVNGLPDWDWVVGSEANDYFPVSQVSVSSEPATLTSRQNLPGSGVDIRNL